MTVRRRPSSAWRRLPPAVSALGWQALGVPEVLSSGNHAEIAATVDPFNPALYEPAIHQYWNAWTAAGQAALNSVVNEQAQVIAYASDYPMLEPVLRRHGVAWQDPRLRPASLDHAMWFHAPFRADEWLLFVQNTPVAAGGHGLANGAFFTQDGRLVATAAQEVLMRERRS